ncbi:YgcG family protein [Leptolyngbya sp. FACHB-261]|uniref:TPM domain-containing protein n=1 Tax=Leptolyngbya sp. FACHB-261 TaxID=2692806 RepID=UPI001688F689|nr:TPM domain-containing protein [Leptolyngbya sp. FACHB-261]MBD2100838.1 TPM domain-containing protein [Leptolyngbya sp. FACHB-261]
MRLTRLAILGLLVWACFGLLGLSPAVAQTNRSETSITQALIPNPRQRQSWIADQGQLLTPASENNLNVRLNDLYNRTGVGLGVATILRAPSNRTPRQLARELLQTWDLRGALLLVTVGERKAEVAIQPYLRASLRDDVVASVLNRTVIPSLNRGNREAGIIAGSHQLADAIQTSLNQPNPSSGNVPLNSIGWGAWALSLLSFFAVGTETLPARLLPASVVQRLKLLYLFGVGCGAVALLMWVAAIAQLSLSVVVIASLVLGGVLFLLVGWSRFA